MVLDIRFPSSLIATYLSRAIPSAAMADVRLGLSTPTFVNSVEESLELTARDGWDFAEFNHLDLPPFSPELLDGQDRRGASFDDQRPCGHRHRLIGRRRDGEQQGEDESLHGTILRSAPV